MPTPVVLDRLAERLEADGLEAELLLVGGAVMTAVFNADPGTRRGTAILGDRSRFARAVAEVGEELGLPGDWISTATRALVRREGVAGRGRDGSHLRVFSPTPEYALALKCFELSAEGGAGGRGAEADVRYLLRLTGVSGSAEAMERIGVFFTRHQLPATLPSRIDALL